MIRESGAFSAVRTSRIEADPLERFQSQQVELQGKQGAQGTLATSPGAPCDLCGSSLLLLGRG